LLNRSLAVITSTKEVMFSLVLVSSFAGLHKNTPRKKSLDFDANRDHITYVTASDVNKDWTCKDKTRTKPTRTRTRT